MPDVATDHAQNIELKTTTVLTGGDSKNTQAEVDAIMDTALPSFLEKKGVNLKTGERTTPEPEKKVEPAKEDKTEIVEDKKEEKSEPEKKEAKVETKTESKPDKKTSKEPKFDDLSDEGINREVESLKTGKQETKERFATVLRQLKEARESGELTKKEYAQAQKDLEAVKKTAEDAAKKSVVPEDVVKQQQAEREELAMFRRQYQLERDPKVKQDFDDRVDSVEQAIGKTLAEAGLPAKAVELIQKSGGWAAFSKSRVPMSWTDVDAEGTQVVRKGTQAEYARYVMDRIDPADASAINARTGEQTLLRDAKDRFISEEKKKASEYFKNIEEQFKKSRDVSAENLHRLTKEFNDWADDISSKEEFLKDEVSGPKATADEKKAIEAANVDRKTIREYIKAQATTTSIDAYKDLVLNAARGKLAGAVTEAAEAEIEAANKRVTELEAELAKVRAGGRSVAKAGSLTGSGATQSESPKKKAAESADDILADLDRFATEHS